MYLGTDTDCDYSKQTAEKLRDRLVENNNEIKVSIGKMDPAIEDLSSLFETEMVVILPVIGVTKKQDMYDITGMCRRNSRTIIAGAVLRPDGRK